MGQKYICEFFGSFSTKLFILQTKDLVLESKLEQIFYLGKYN